YEYHLRAELLESAQPMRLHSTPETAAVGIRRQWNVDHPRGTPFDSAVRIKRMLERRHHQHALVVAEDILGPVPVVDAEVDPRRPVQAVPIERVRNADGDVIEEAEPHCALPLCMMSWRAHATERIRCFAAEHQVGSENHRPGRS